MEVASQANPPGARARTHPEYSSGGVLFTTGFSLPIGKLVEVGINWPVPEPDCGLQLTARGRVVRSDAGCTAVEFRQREFSSGW